MVKENSVEVLAEIKKVTSRKSASLDIIYQVTFETSDPNLMSLGVIPADIMVKLEVTPQ